ncbi:hypothetical protein HY992_05725 [Candidatus Micrarchaeota archaeon]|nr:hypothetical protein [Candidatus Micrarchaeota archaeon]
MFNGRHVAFVALLFFVVSTACFAVAEKNTRLVLSTEGNYAVAKLYAEVTDTGVVNGTVEDDPARDLIGELPRTETPTGDMYSFQLLENEPVTFEKIITDRTTGAVSREMVFGCVNKRTGSRLYEDLGTVKCDVSTVASSIPGMGMNCVQVIAVYDGSVIIGREYNPAESNVISKCSGAVASPLANILDNEDEVKQCLPLFILMGLLIGAMYVQGRNPLALFDITTPKLPKAKKYQFQKLRRQLGWSQAYYTFMHAGVSRSAQLAKGMSALTGKMEKAGIDSDKINEIKRSNAPTHEKITRLRDLFEQYERGATRNVYAVSDIGKSLNAMENFDQISRVHAQTQKEMAATVGMSAGFYQPVTAVGRKLGSWAGIQRKPSDSIGAKMVNMAIGTADYGMRSVIAGPVEGLVSAVRVARVGGGAVASAGASGVLAVAKRVSPGIAATALGRGLKKMSGVFARLPGQTVLNTNNELKRWNDTLVRELKAWAVAELEAKAGRNNAMGAELLAQMRDELLKNRKANYDERKAIIERYLRITGRFNTPEVQRIRHAYDRVSKREKEIAESLARGGSMSSAENQKRHVELVNLVRDYKVLTRPKTVQEAINRMVERRLLDVAYRQRVISEVKVDPITGTTEIKFKEGPVFMGAYNSAENVYELREQVATAVAAEFGLKSDKGVVTTQMVKGVDMAIPGELAEHLSGFEGNERVALVRLEEWQRVYSDIVYKKELHVQLEDKGVADKLDSTDQHDIDLIAEARRTAGDVASVQSNELSAILAREANTENKVVLARQMVMNEGPTADPDTRVANALKDWAEESTIERIETRMAQMGLHSIQESLDNYQNSNACAGELDRVMAEFNATKGTALVDTAEKVLGEDFQKLQDQITDYNNADEAGKRTIMDGGLRDELNALTLRVANADESRRAEIIRLAYEKGVRREVVVEARDRNGNILTNADGTPQLEDMHMRSTRDLVDSLKLLGYEQEVKDLNLRNGDVELDKKGLMRQGGEVSYEMTQTTAWVAKPEGVWMPIPLRDPHALANVKMGNADAPINAELYVVRRSRDGTVERLEKYAPEDSDQANYLQSIPVAELNERGLPTGRVINAVEGGVVPSNVEEVIRGAEAPIGTGVVAEKDEEGRRTGRAVSASGNLKWRELLAAKYLVFRQKNKDFVDAELRGKPVREESNKVFNAWAKGEHALLRPVQRGFEAGLYASAERYMRPALNFKATLEQSAETMREFDTQLEAGKYSARMSELNIDSNRGAYVKAVDAWLAAKNEEREAKRMRNTAGLVAAKDKTDEAREKMRELSEERGADGIRKLGCRTKYSALVEMRYKVENELKQLKAEQYHFEKQAKEAQKQLDRINAKLAVPSRLTEVEEDKLKAETQRLERERDGAIANMDSIDAKIKGLEVRRDFKREIERELKVAKGEMDSFVASTKADAKEFDFVLADAQTWMHNVADLRFPLSFKLLNAATTEYGGGRYVPGPYPMGPHMYMNPFDALRGKMAFGALWGGMLAPEHRFGQDFLRMVRAPIMHMQGVPMPYEPMTGFKQDRGLTKMIKSYIRTALPYKWGGVMPGQEYTPKYSVRKSVEYAQHAMRAGTPTGRSVFAFGELGSRYGGLQVVSKALHDTRSIIDETLQDQSLVDSVVGLTPEQNRDMNLRHKGGYSPANRYAMWATTRSPMGWAPGSTSWRIGTQAAAHLVKLHPHLANEMTRESAGMDTYYRNKSIAEKTAELESSYKILRPWETPGFVPVLPPVMLIAGRRWIKGQFRESSEERRRKKRERETGRTVRGLVYMRPEWERNRVLTATMNDAYGLATRPLALAGAFAAGPFTALGIVQTPDLMDKMRTARTITGRRKKSNLYSQVKYCSASGKTYDSHVAGACCPHCKIQH